MLSQLEKARFCSVCGNENKPHSGSLREFILEPRTACSECARRLRLPRRRVILLTLVILAGAVSFRSLLSSRSPTPSVSAWNARGITGPPLPTPSLSLEMVVKEQCGARTKKGTPCKRMAPHGERCSQHKGQPSILKK